MSQNFTTIAPNLSVAASFPDQSREPVYQSLLNLCFDPWWLSWHTLGREQKEVYTSNPKYLPSEISHWTRHWNTSHILISARYTQVQCCSFWNLIAIIKESAMIGACYFKSCQWIFTISCINFVWIILRRTHVCQPDVYSTWKLRSKREHVNKTSIVFLQWWITQIKATLIPIVTGWLRCKYRGLD